jgi:hypothetical protein
VCYHKLRGLRLSCIAYCAGRVVLRLNDLYKNSLVGIVCEGRNTFLACDSSLRAGKYRYMASVFTLASDEKETAEFGCRWMPKGAHSQRLHGLMACTEYNCLFLYRRAHYIREEFFDRWHWARKSFSRSVNNAVCISGQLVAEFANQSVLPVDVLLCLLRHQWKTLNGKTRNIWRVTLIPLPSSGRLHKRKMVDGICVIVHFG